ncbi:protein windbeutel [Dermatophagoides farinae]|uniref:protein windbeutel n=1 Tax=Dermatophagoides farinae TaxID=6954 RepID=UPI003F61508E
MMMMKQLIWFRLMLSMIIAVDQCCGQHYLGVIESDQLTFDLIASRFHYVLVKFDHLYAYGSNQDVFNQLALDTMNNTGREDIIFINLEVKDFDDHQCMDLVNRYGIEKKQFPAIRLFINAEQFNVEKFKTIKPIEYPLQRNQSNRYQPDKIILDPTRLRLFLRQYTTIRLLLPNCTEYLDRVATEFVHTLNNGTFDEQNRIIDKMKMMAKQKLNNDDNLYGWKQLNQYIFWMKYGQKHSDGGGDGNSAKVYDDQHERLKSILWNENGHISWTKRQQLQVRFNVLQSFRLTNDEQQNDDDGDNDTIDSHRKQEF